MPKSIRGRILCALRCLTETYDKRWKQVQHTTLSRYVKHTPSFLSLAKSLLRPSGVFQRSPIMAIWSPSALHRTWDPRSPHSKDSLIAYWFISATSPLVQGYVWLYLTVNGLIGTVLSDLLWLWSVLLTSPLVATIGLRYLTITNMH